MQEAANSSPAQKARKPSSMRGLSCYRCHGQLSRTCVPNLSCDYFNQSCSAEEVILPHEGGKILPHEAK